MADFKIWMNGRLVPGDDGILRVTADAATGSHRLAAASTADVLIVVPEGVQSLPAGSVVEVLPL